MINSPLNYSGNKYKVLNELIPLLPSVDTVVEIFAGSALVSLNSTATHIVLNDYSPHTISLLEYFYTYSGNYIIKSIENIIADYGFTDTFHRGNECYSIIRHEGLSLYNKDSFERLKKDYNQDPTVDKLFALIIYGFNHYLRFNRLGLFNVPVGKVDFSKSLREKTIDYADAFKKKKVKFSNCDFRDSSLYCLDKDVLYYFDPPYLITNAPYNACWKEEEETALLSILDYLDCRGIPFALSNVIQSNGKQNELLLAWSRKYNIHYLRRQYRNANYRRKNITETIEVLITNY